MVHETVTHGRPPDRFGHPAPRVQPRRRGGRRLRGPGVPGRQDQRGALVRPPRDQGRGPGAPRPHPRGPAATSGPTTEVGDARFAPAEADGILPDDFYSTTNFDTFVRVGGKWVEAARPEDGLRPGPARRRAALREAGPGEEGRAGGAARARASGCGPPERSRDFSVFGFMSNDVSAEINKGIVIPATAREMRETRAAGEQIVVVAGPAVVHSGGDGAARARWCATAGWTCSSPATPSPSTTWRSRSWARASGICQMSGRAVEGGSRNHLYAINAVNRAGRLGRRSSRAW